MARGLERKVAGITFNRTEIVKAVTSNRPPSNFWGINQVVNSVDDKKSYNLIMAGREEIDKKERNFIIDKESGKDLNRKGYQALINALLRQGDTLIIKSLDRLSRNKYDIKKELEYFKTNNIRLKVIDLPTTMLNLPTEQEWVLEMVNNILIEVLGTIAEQ